MEYTTVKNEASDFFIEKKSKFIGSCAPVQTEEQALAFIAKIKAEHADASHNVYAYILRTDRLERFSDDGEPQGKAGIPILDAMKKSVITDAVIVATRYYGGTMLGGGGLIRAYSHTASIAIQAAAKLVMRECLLVSVVCDYNLYGRVSALVSENGGVIEGTEFLQDVKISFHLPEEIKDELERKIQDATNGRSKLIVGGKRFFEF